MPEHENALKEEVPKLTTSADNGSGAPRRNSLLLWLIALIGPAAAFWVWKSPLSFVPVPWPDDSAFYFVAKDLFHIPPRWVMLPQAPFEPTYRIWNFNTMPLYPILLGLGRLIGIDGSHALKLWPLGFWALSGSFFGVALYRAGLPALLAALATLAIAMDPTLRWASVLVRPESLIGLCGIILVTGLSLGWFTRKDYRDSLWDPIAALLAVGAYAHFNAVHLLFAVMPVLIFRPRRLLEVAQKTLIYLLPWLITVALKPQLFFHQMALQWERLAVHNAWLESASSAINSIFQSLGSPEAWPSILQVASVVIWVFISVAIAVLAVGLGRYLVSSFRLRKLSAESPVDAHFEGGVSLIPAAGWVLGSVWLWHNKPEVWFVFYLHLAVWTFTGLALLKLWKMRRQFLMGFLTAMTGAVTAIFFYVNAGQAYQLGKSPSWNWDTYHEFVDCVDRTLSKYAEQRGTSAPLTVWAPTFPDITIELSKKHPDWALTRTNDFHARNHLAIQHGFETDAVVVTEMLNWQERNIDAPWGEHPEVHSVWMDWKDYYLNTFMRAPGWKPNRHVCQKGRWQAFIFMR